ncbi:DUF397 domain-containing protein [Streptomyces sp. PSKA28]|uniref:DUF397 domain-containing protein n=1 Tax=Streptomyces himalayensis subsp. himalayensis TaxID=2756131 RepID=A0A7W0DFS3_9ACTN|nr:DUF397 domain-containing protein [Streptomyces himalayensis subsp. himalayensis]
MPPFAWQKSTFSPDGSDCVYVAATPDGTILLRESDEPEVMLSTGPRQLRAFIANLRTADRMKPA